MRNCGETSPAFQFPVSVLLQAIRKCFLLQTWTQDMYYTCVVIVAKYLFLYDINDTEDSAILHLKMDEEFETQSDLELSIHDYVEDNSEPVQEFLEVCDQH